MAWKDTIQPASTEANQTSWKDTITQPEPAVASWRDTVQPAEPSLISQAGDIASQGYQAAKDIGTEVVTNPKGTLEKIGDFGTSVVESTPRTIATGVKNIGVGLGQAVIDAQAIGDTGAKAVLNKVGINALDDKFKERELLRDFARGGISYAADKAIPTDKLTPAEDATADVLGVLVPSVGAGLRAAKVAKSAPAASRVIEGFKAGVGTEAAVSGTNTNLDTMVLGDETTDQVVKNRILNPLEGLAIGAGIEGLGATAKLLKNNASEIYNKIYDRTDLFRDIEAETKGIKPKQREDTPDTAKIQLETQRQFLVPEINITQGVAKRGADGHGVDLMTKGDIGIAENSDEALPGLEQVFERIKDAGGNSEEAAKYMQYKRIAEDHDIGLTDTASRDTAIAEAKAKIRALTGNTDNRTIDANALEVINPNKKVKAVDTSGMSIDVSDSQKKVKSKSDSAVENTGYASPDDAYAISRLDKEINSFKDTSGMSIDVSGGKTLSRDAAIQQAKEELEAAKALKIRRDGIALPIDEVKSYIAKSEEQPWAGVARDNFKLYFRGLLKTTFDEGLKDASEYKNLDNFYDNFFPAFRQQLKEDNSAHMFGSSTSKGTGIMAAKGGTELPYKDPLESVLEYTTRVSVAGQSNATLNRMMDVLEKAPEAKWNQLFNTPKEAYEAQRVGVTLNKYKNMLKSGEIEATDDIASKLDLEDFGDIGMNAKEGNMTFYRNGKKISLEVSDKQLRETLESLTPKTMDKVTTVLNKLSAVQRNAIVLNPGFSLANMLMDTSIAGITSRTGALPLLVTGQGLVRMARDKPLYQQYLRDTGGGTSWINYAQARSEQEVKTAIDAIKGDYKKFGFSGQGPVATAKRNLGSTYKGLETVLNRAENAARFEEYARSLKQGADRTTAATRSGELSVNFQQRGTGDLFGVADLQQINKVGLFLNATLQSQDRAYRIIKSNPEKLVKVALGTITAPALALYSLNSTHPEYYNIPERIRHSNWIWMYGPNIEDRIQIPMDRTIAPIFAGAVMAALDDVHEQTGGAITGHQLVEAIKPLIAIPNATPPLFQTIWNLGTNTDWQGRAIVPEYMRNQPAVEQFNERTRPTYRSLAEVTSKVKPLPDFLKSPTQLEYIASQTLGVLEDTITSFMTDPAARKALDLPDPAKKDLGELPVIGRFFGNIGRDSTQAVYSIANTLRDDLDNYESYKRSLNSESAQDQSTLKRAEEYFGEGNAEKVSFIETLKDTMEDMKQYNEQLRNVSADPDISPEEKQNMNKDLVKGRDEVAKGFLEFIKTDPSYRKFYGNRYSSDFGITPALTGKILDATKDE